MYSYKQVTGSFLHINQFFQQNQGKILVVEVVPVILDTVIRFCILYLESVKITGLYELQNVYPDKWKLFCKAYTDKINFISVTPYTVRKTWSYAVLLNPDKMAILPWRKQLFDLATEGVVIDEMQLNDLEKPSDKISASARPDILVAVAEVPKVEVMPMDGKSDSVRQELAKAEVRSLETAKIEPGKIDPVKISEVRPPEAAKLESAKVEPAKTGEAHQDIMFDTSPAGRERKSKKEKA